MVPIPRHILSALIESTQDMKKEQVGGGEEVLLRGCCRWLLRGSSREQGYMSSKCIVFMCKMCKQKYKQNDSQCS